MSSENVLEKTTRVNLLYDFYAPLLTEKQRTFMSCYYLEDLSLGEISTEFSISRQAVYEHIKRAEVTLEAYEDKLGLLTKHEQRVHCINELRAVLETLEESDAAITLQLRQAKTKIDQLQHIDD